LGALSRAIKDDLRLRGDFYVSLKDVEDPDDDDDFLEDALDRQELTLETTDQDAPVEDQSSTTEDEDRLVEDGCSLGQGLKSSLIEWGRKFSGHTILR